MLRAFRRARAYVKHDLREVINPTSLPNPPDYVQPRRLTWREWRTAFQKTNHQYRESWKGDQEVPQDSPPASEGGKQSLRSELSETAQAALLKGQGLRPLLHQIYETRARSYRDAVQQFVEGYKEGFIGKASMGTEHTESHTQHRSTTNASHQPENAAAEVQTKSKS